MPHFLKHVLWTTLCPGTVTVLIPYFILDRRSANISENWFTGAAGIVLIVIGTATLLSCIYMFAKHGKGTLSPADPARHLVIHGLYRYVRNPMYVGVMIILLGESVLFQSWTLVFYAAIVFLFFNLFIILYEEPYLKSYFGQPYIDYRKKVGRWIPGRRYIQPFEPT